MKQILPQEKVLLIFKDSSFHAWRDEKHLSNIVLMRKPQHKYLSLGWAETNKHYSSLEEWLKTINNESKKISYLELFLFVDCYENIQFGLAEDENPFDPIWTYENTKIGYIYVENVSKIEADTIIHKDLKMLNTYFKEGYFSISIYQHNGDIEDGVEKILGMDKVIETIHKYYPEFISQIPEAMKNIKDLVLVPEIN